MQLSSWTVGAIIGMLSKAADSEETTTKVAESFEEKLIELLAAVAFYAVIFTLKLLYYKI